MELYLDGVASEINNASGWNRWQIVKSADFPPGTKLIAVKVVNVFGWAGLLASASDNSVVTNESWLVSDTFVAGWNQPEFYDGKWGKAFEQGANDDHSPWKRWRSGETLTRISSSAKWIWNENTTKDTTPVQQTMYFRLGRSVL